MKRYLLDVNVLLALLLPGHDAHASACAWFDRSGGHAWATNALTQLGALRLLTNPAVTQGGVGAATAWELLKRATQHAGHEFWPLGREMPAGLESMSTRIQGHQQWTNAILLWQAMQKNGVLVTFDAGLAGLAAGKLRHHLLLLKRA